MLDKINIAIDGYSSCGKGTLAKSIAQKLGYLFIDSGAMYRAVTLYLLQNNIPISQDTITTDLLKNINISFEYDADVHRYLTYLNGKNIEEQIRTLSVGDKVSEVSAISEVRKFLVTQQREIGKNKGVVMDGRDIGTVVFPDAELKIFMIANPNIRAQRRFKELTEQGKNVTFEEVLKNIQKRDHIDSTRSDSPLKKAIDAKELDNSSLTKDAQTEIVMEWIGQILQNRNTSI